MFELIFYILWLAGLNWFGLLDPTWTAISTVGIIILYIINHAPRPQD
jgi:hypothetical protein